MFLHKEQSSEREISKRLAHSKTAVHQSIMKFKNFGTYKDKKWSRRLRKATLRDDNLIRPIAVRSPTVLCKKIKSALLQKGISINRTTVSRILVHDFHLKTHKPA